MPDLKNRSDGCCNLSGGVALIDVIHHERNVREEQKYLYVARTSKNGVISSGDLCCCLLPRCEALRTCRSGFPIATWDTVFLVSLQKNTIKWRSGRSSVATIPGLEKQNLLLLLQSFQL